MVEDVEELRTELQVFGFRQAEVLGGSEVPVGVGGADIHIATLGAELSRISYSVQPLERARVQPGVDGFRTIIGISHQVGTLRGEPRDLGCATLRGDIVRIKNGEWGSAHQSGDAAQLPSSEHVLVPA